MRNWSTVKKDEKKKKEIESIFLKQATGAKKRSCREIYQTDGKKENNILVEVKTTVH